jgi:hypothetical protein
LWYSARSESEGPILIYINVSGYTNITMAVGSGQSGFSNRSKGRSRQNTRTRRESATRGYQTGRYAKGVSEIGSSRRIGERMTQCQVPTGVDLKIDVDACNAAQHSEVPCSVVPDGRAPAVAHN